ncbi:MAG: CP12 domain-containing protein, partial [Dolichospermum sp.]
MTNTQTASDIQDKIEKEVEEARSVCDISGSNSAECAAAWDA